MKKEHVDIIHRCFRCGWCKFPTNYVDINCPAYLKYRFESFSSGGRMWLIRAWLNGEIESSERFAEVLFTCVTCKNCVEACALDKIKDSLCDIFIDARSDLVEQGRIPPPVRDYFKAMSVNGNPFRMPREERGAWAGNPGVPLYDSQEYLFHVGDVGSYDELGMKMASNTAALLDAAGVDFGILGNGETSDGNDVRALGENGLFEVLAEENIRKFEDLGVRKVITLSPHAYNAFRNDYPWKDAPEVIHFSQLLGMLAFTKRLPASRTDAKVAFHDSCYLGRWNGEYESARFALSAVPGLELVEMDRNRNNALCCGGGGGNFFTDMLGGGVDSASRVRVREAADAGADILAVACPQCLRMLSDAAKDEGLDSLEVIDLASVIGG